MRPAAAFSLGRTTVKLPQLGLKRNPFNHIAGINGNEYLATSRSSKQGALSKFLGGTSMIRKSGYRFSERSCSNKKIERDDDSKKSHHALDLDPKVNYAGFGSISSHRHMKFLERPLRGLRLLGRFTI